MCLQTKLKREILDTVPNNPYRCKPCPIPAKSKELSTYAAIAQQSYTENYVEPSRRIPLGSLRPMQIPDLFDQDDPEIIETAATMEADTHMTAEQTALAMNGLRRARNIYANYDVLDCANRKLDGTCPARCD